jgi:cytochrome c oxidase subunit 3
METGELKIKPSPEVKADLNSAYQKAAKPLLWVGIVSIVMLFAGFTSAYVVRADNGNWLVFQLPSAFYLSTAVIITSSITLYLSHQAAKQNNQKRIVLGLILTFILGVVFTYLQFSGYQELLSQKIFFAGKSANASGSFLYLITFMHLLHLFVGMIALLVTLKNGIKGRYTSENTLGLELCSIYWHFLDFLWVYLFLFLYFIR